MADAAATAAAGVAIALYIFTDTNDEPIAVPLLGVELRQHTHSGLKALVEPRVLCLGFSTFEVSSGKLHVVDEPEEGLPTRPTGHPLEPTGSAVIAVGKAILLDLGTGEWQSVPPPASAPALPAPSRAHPCPPRHAHARLLQPDVLPLRVALALLLVVPLPVVVPLV